MSALRTAWALVALATVPAMAGGLNVDIVGSRQYMVAFDMNGSGTVCGDNQIDGMMTAVAWNPVSGATVLTGSTGMSQAGGINGVGDVVGWYTSPVTGLDTAVIWTAESGYTARLETGLPPAVRSDTFTYTQGYAINDFDEVAVAAGIYQHELPDGTRLDLTEDMYRWTRAGGFVKLNHLSAARSSSVRDINNLGTIAGHSTGRDSFAHAVLWTKTSGLRDLGYPKGSRGAYAMAITDAGVVAGYTEYGRNAWTWTEQRGFNVLADYGFGASALDLNDHGIVCGSARNPYGETVPVVWDASGNIYDLQALLGYDRYYLFDEAMAIDNANQVVVYGYNMENGDRDAVVLQLTFTP